jgi:hypothetical protein
MRRSTGIGLGSCVVCGWCALALLACGGESTAGDPSSGGNPSADDGAAGSSDSNATGSGGSFANVDAPFGDVPRTQGALWLALANAVGGTCPSMQGFELPSGARETIEGNTGAGDRIVDVESNVVACSVARGPDSDDPYPLTLFLSSGDIGAFQATGLATTRGSAALQVALTTASVSLQQNDCTATTKVLDPDGAVWLQSLSCPVMRDAASPAVSCALTGGVIFENCR